MQSLLETKGHITRREYEPEDVVVAPGTGVRPHRALIMRVVLGTVLYRCMYYHLPRAIERGAEIPSFTEEHLFIGLPVEIAPREPDDGSVLPVKADSVIAQTAVGEGVPVFLHGMISSESLSDCKII
jgi:hypothetical protein